jgi:hypothetical protein
MLEEARTLLHVVTTTALATFISCQHPKARGHTGMVCYLDVPAGAFKHRFFGIILSTILHTCSKIRKEVVLSSSKKKIALG